MGRHAAPRLALAGALAASALLLAACDSEAYIEVQNGTDAPIRVEVAHACGHVEVVSRALAAGEVAEWGDVGDHRNDRPREFGVLRAYRSDGTLTYERRLVLRPDPDWCCRVVIETGDLVVAAAPAVCTGGADARARIFVIANAREDAVRILFDGDRGEIAPGDMRTVGLWQDDSPRMLTIVDEVTGNTVLERPILWSDARFREFGEPPDLVVR